jgi:hypothetical protein
MELLLEKNELMSMGRQLKGCTIICTEGRCWVTQEKNHTDYILAPGKELQVACNGHLVVTATEDCRIKVVLPDRERTFWERKLLPQVSLLRCT